MCSCTFFFFVFKLSESISLSFYWQFYLLTLSDFSFCIWSSTCAYTFQICWLGTIGNMQMGQRKMNDQSSSTAYFLDWPCFFSTLSMYCVRQVWKFDWIQAYFSCYSVFQFGMFVPWTGTKWQKMVITAESWCSVFADSGNVIKERKNLAQE